MLLIHMSVSPLNMLFYGQHCGCIGGMIKYVSMCSKSGSQYLYDINTLLTIHVWNRYMYQLSLLPCSFHFSNTI
jgi:hypothetical protein